MESAFRKKKRFHGKLSVWSFWLNSPHNLIPKYSQTGVRCLSFHGSQSNYHYSQWPLQWHLVPFEAPQDISPVLGCLFIKRVGLPYVLCCIYQSQTVVLSFVDVPKHLYLRKYINPCPPLNILGASTPSPCVDTYFRWLQLGADFHPRCLFTEYQANSFLGARSKGGYFPAGDSKGKSEHSSIVKETSLDDIYMGRQ